MVRVKRGNVARNRRNKILKLAKVLWCSFKFISYSKPTSNKSLVYSYIGRKEKKRIFRRLWITRINAAASQYNLKYSRFIYNLKRAKILLNRKMLSQLAILDPAAFSYIVEATK